MRDDIRFAIPSNGRLEKDSLEFLKACGLPVRRINPRQYTGTIRGLPEVTAMWQRQNDIVRGVRSGSIDFAIVGLDALRERCIGDADQPEKCENILVLHDALDISHCELYLAVPDGWSNVETVSDLKQKAVALYQNEGRALRVASKFQHLTRDFLDRQGVSPYKIVKLDGTLEIAPAIGLTDIIADLVSTGTTLRANQLKPLRDAPIIESQGVLIANKEALKQNDALRKVAYDLLEYIEAYLRAKGCYTVTANMRGESPGAISTRMLDKAHIRGLQGPTISQVVPHDPANQANANWYAINIVVKKKDLSPAIRELREIGGSGVIVTEVKYIFEEVPDRYEAMLKAIAE
ncbi:MAG: ATP phosphoribosyltransferase [Chloroflexota bacterium]